MPLMEVCRVCPLWRCAKCAPHGGVPSVPLVEVCQVCPLWRCAECALVEVSCGCVLSVLLIWMSRVNLCVVCRGEPFMLECCSVLSVYFFLCCVFMPETMKFYLWPLHCSWQHSALEVLSIECGCVVHLDCFWSEVLWETVLVC